MREAPNSPIILIIEKDEAARLLLKAIVNSVDQDLELKFASSLREAKDLLFTAVPVRMVILGNANAGSRARLGFIAFLKKSYPDIQFLIIRSSKGVRGTERTRTKEDSVKLDKMKSFYLSLHLDLDQSRKLIQRLLYDQ